MNRQELTAALSDELRHIAPDIDVKTVDKDADLRDEFDIDSMDFLNLVTALSKRYGIPIPETDYPSLSSFSGAVAYLAEKTGTR